MSEPPQASSIDSPPPNSPPSVGPGVGHHRISATSANTISIALKQDFGLKINPTPLEEHDVEVSDEPAPEQGRFNDLVRELNEGRYRSGVFVKLFTWLKEIFTHYDRKADLVQRSFNGVQNQEALMVAAFNSVASQENRENIKENMGNLLRFCQTADPNSI
ncbi:MAG: hypothetical protein LBB17_00325, partial [Puniceicoccales bacterium]|nr:hypothetical protein [Puniceicoccales bacterium]